MRKLHFLLLIAHQKFEKLSIEIAQEIGCLVELEGLLAVPAWRKQLKAEDYRALTPLIYTHVNPYGRFDLDTGHCLPIGESLAPASWALKPRRKRE